jgi:GT2 family glycosyltransferase
VMGSAEDIDLAFRLISKGLLVKPVRSAIGYHIDHPTRQTTGQRELLVKKMQEQIIRTNPRSWVD